MLGNGPSMMILLAAFLLLIGPNLTPNWWAGNSKQHLFEETRAWRIVMATQATVTARELKSWWLSGMLWPQLAPRYILERNLQALSTSKQASKTPAKGPSDNFYPTFSCSQVWQLGKVPFSALTRMVPVAQAIKFDAQHLPAVQLPTGLISMSCGYLKFRL